MLFPADEYYVIIDTKTNSFQYDINIFFTVSAYPRAQPLKCTSLASASDRLQYLLKKNVYYVSDSYGVPYKECLIKDADFQIRSVRVKRCLGSVNHAAS